MAEPKAPNGSDRFNQWLSYWFARPVGKLVLTAILCLLLAGSAWLDDHARTPGVKSLPIAPSREDFWLSLQFGAAIGLVAFLGDLLYSLCLVFARLLGVRSSHQHPQRKELWAKTDAVWTSSWGVMCFVLFVVLSVWCVFHEVIPLPAWIAALAVIIPGILVLQLVFGADTQDEPRPITSSVAGSSDSPST